MSQGRIFSYISSKRPIWDSGKEYRTLYRYEAQEEDELSLEEGQVRPHSVPAGGHLYISLNPLWHPKSCPLYYPLCTPPSTWEWWASRRLMTTGGWASSTARRVSSLIASSGEKSAKCCTIIRLRTVMSCRSREARWVEQCLQWEKNYVVFTVILKNRTLYRPLVWLEISPIFTEVGRPWQGRRGGLVERWTAGGNWSLSVFLCRGIVNQNQH